MKKMRTYICKFIWTTTLIFCFSVLQNTNAAISETHNDSFVALQDTTKTSSKKSSSGNRISITQQGSGNSASVSQSGITDSDSKSTIKISGSKNMVKLKSVGHKAESNIVMNGTGNRLTIHPGLYMNIFSLQLLDEPKVNKTNEFHMIFRNMERAITIHQTDDDNLITIEEE